MKRLPMLVLCGALFAPVVSAETAPAKSVAPPPATPTTTATAARPAPKSPVAATATASRIKSKPVAEPGAGAVSAVSNPACTNSKTVVLFGIAGKGCRETKPMVWQAQMCPTTVGCCNDADGCLVPSAANAIRGDGIY